MDASLHLGQILHEQANIVKYAGNHFGPIATLGIFHPSVILMKSMLS